MVATEPEPLYAYREQISTKEAEFKVKSETKETKEAKQKDKSAEVAEWRKNNPDGTKAQCCRELKLTKPTVYKWWEQKND